MLAITASMYAWGDAVPSGELFATYQKFGDTFYEGGGEANLEATSHSWAVNYYIVSCGDSVLLRATTTEDRNLENGWPTQLRIWTGTYNNSNEIQVNAGDNKNRYTSTCKRIAPSAADVKIHMFLNWIANSTTETFAFNRASINNPIDDNTAPVIDPTEVSMAEVDGKLVFTFGDVTADDQYFYYVADKDHNVGGISLTNKVYITKPTVEDGTTYKFKCYAVDYNGNKSAYKEFTLTMPFDENVDLARNKPASAGAVQNDNTADRAVNGNAGQFWTCFGQGDASTTWWKVDLTNIYDLDHIMIHFNDIGAAYNIYASVDNVNWTAIVEAATASSNETKTHTSLTSSARYLKVTSSNRNFGIREFEVYASGLAAADATNPTVSASCTATTVNTATLQIIAADEDDAHNAGTITSIKVTGDNGFAEQEVLAELDGENKVTLSGLTYNKTYHFTVTAYDLAGNHASDNVEVVLPFNTALNLAEGKTCSAGNYETGHSPSAANDGDADTYWGTYNKSPYTTANVWSVDLGDAYVLDHIAIYTGGFDGHGAHTITLKGKMNEGDAYTTIFDNVSVSASSDYSNIPVVASARYLEFSADKDWMISIKEFEVYGTAFAAADKTNPIVAVTCPTKTINSATLQVNATDKDDLDGDGAIRAIHISGDNGFVTQRYVILDGSNQVTLSELNYNTTYTFTVTVVDLAGNEASTNITVQLPLNTNFNLAEGKTAVAGKIQDGNGANKGCDGKLETTFSTYGTEDHSKEYWYVDLEDIYTIRQVAITWGNDYSQHFLIQGATTLPEESVRENDDAWTTYLDYTYESDPESTKQEHALVGKMRYLRLKSLHNEIHLGINFKELEVYGSDYAELDETAPVLSTKECSTDTETATATITLVANDAVDGAIKDFYISCADPVMAETKYTTNASDQIAITGLAVDKDYTFDIRFRDLSGNWNTTSVIAHFAMALGTNVAEGKTATAGREERADNAAGKAVDGNDGTYWGCYPNTSGVAETWLKVDLVNGFKLENIAIKWEHYPDEGGIVIEGSLNDADYSEIVSYSGDRFSQGNRQVLEITGVQASIPYRYVRIKAEDQSKYMSIYEFEVYASEEIALLSFGDLAENNSDLIAAHHGETSNVVLNRNINADNTWYTLCLPFDMDADKVNEVFGASTIATLTGSEDRGSLIHLNFEYVDAIEAGKPYMIKVSNSFASGTQIEGVTIKNVGPTEVGDDVMKFVGTYDKIMLTGENKRYVSANNTLYSPNPNGGSKIGAFRCYFTIPEGSSAPGRQAVIVFGPQTATGCENIATPEMPSKIMLNGVLYILRDGKTYNAQGQLIQ